MMLIQYVCATPYDMLREAESELQKRMSMEQIATHPRLVSWRDAYRSFCAKSSKFRASIEVMIRRVVSNNKLPPINAIVDIGNLQLCVK